MKILFFTRLFYPHIGGVEIHTQRICEELIKKGHKVTVITIRFDDSLCFSDKIHGIKVKRFIQPKIKFIGLFYTWFWLLRNIRLIKESDIIHIHDVFIWYIPFRFLFPRKKVFVTFHGWEGRYPIPINNRFQKKVAEYLSSGVICVGEYIKKHYGLKKVDFVVYGAVDLPKSVSKKDPKKIVYVGRLEKDTGLPIFLEGFKKMIKVSEFRDFNIDFCGDGSLSSECGVLGKVHGFCNPKPFLEKASICFASGYLTVLEGFANRCSVFVAYDNELKKDYFSLSPFSDLIFKVKKSDEILEKIRFFQTEKREVFKMREDAYNWVRKQTWEGLVEKYIRLWNI